jgi:hypothetical protein
MDIEYTALELETIEILQEMPEYSHLSREELYPYCQMMKLIAEIACQETKEESK